MGVKSTSQYFNIIQINITYCVEKIEPKVMTNIMCDFDLWNISEGKLSDISQPKNFVENFQFTTCNFAHKTLMAHKC